ncbi:MAG: UV DNA damage repair endonuclease UvsE [Saccharofermentanales bacterium]
MRIGYACLTIGVPDTGQKSCIKKNASTGKLTELIRHNLASLENIIDYNIQNNIKLFRISSDLIPFGSDPVNNVPWWLLFEEQLKLIGQKIKDSDMRVSMHPGQYTVLNSVNDDIVKNAIQDLNYHARVLESLEIDCTNKIILHIGGVYNDKKQSVKRFCENYRRLNDSVKSRLVIENDDKSYNISEVLQIGRTLGIPVVFDNLHHAVNPPENSETENHWINECKQTWTVKDGIQKIHYSQQDDIKKHGSHSGSIKIDEFISFYKRLQRDDLDIMLEVKDKNISAIKCINSTSVKSSNRALEIEWGRYKYKVLEKSQETYLSIRRHFNDKNDFSPVLFYNLVEEALRNDENTGNSINAALHVWGYFKNSATKNEKEKFMSDITKFENGTIQIQKIKNQLWRLAVKYQQKYLLNSYYFLPI